MKEINKEFMWVVKISSPTSCWIYGKPDWKRKRQAEHYSQEYCKNRVNDSKIEFIRIKVIHE